MRRDGLSPDKMTFNNAITAMGASGQWEAAGLLLVEMRAAGLPPDAVSSGYIWFPRLILVGIKDTACCRTDVYSEEVTVSACGLKS